jgi:[acyl-carrier-protein] S-malonyltransferase
VRALCTPDEIRDALGEALLLPVRWIDGIALLGSLGVDAAWEAGPGRTLTKLARRIGAVPFIEA